MWVSILYPSDYSAVFDSTIYDTALRTNVDFDLLY